MSRFFIASGLVSIILGVSLIRSLTKYRHRWETILGILFTIAGIFIFITGFYLLL